jgi:hypothetical protein
MGFDFGFFLVHPLIDDLLFELDRNVIKSHFRLFGWFNFGSLFFGVLLIKFLENFGLSLLILVVLLLSIFLVLLSPLVCRGRLALLSDTDKVCFCFGRLDRLFKSRLFLITFRVEADFLFWLRGCSWFFVRNGIHGAGLGWFLHLNYRLLFHVGSLNMSSRDKCI